MSGRVSGVAAAESRKYQTWKNSCVAAANPNPGKHKPDYYQTQFKMVRMSDAGFADLMKVSFTMN